MHARAEAKNKRSSKDQVSKGERYRGKPPNKSLTTELEVLESECDASSKSKSDEPCQEASISSLSMGKTDYMKVYLIIQLYCCMVNELHALHDYIIYIVILE